MASINVSKLSFAYENSHDYIFRDVSFAIDTDHKTGFCGRNGRGKTTFLRLLLGEFEYSGTIASGNIKFDYFPFRPRNANNLTQEVLEEVAPNAQLWQIKKELASLVLDEGVLYQTFSTLSNGEQTKVLLAGLFLNDNHFLLIDEPTNHLDMRAREIVARYLNSKKGFILVSHDRVFLDECVDHILSINKNNIEVVSGNFSTWLENKQRRDSFELAQNERLESEIDRLKKAARQKATFAHSAEDKKKGAADKGFMGAKAARQMKTAKIIERRRERAVDDKAGLLQNIESSYTLKIQPQKHHSSRLVTLKDIAINYDGRTIFNKIDETLFKSILHKLDFSATQFDKDMAHFSQGQKKKVLIARSLATKAHLYIWDEPLNYIDVLSRIQIEELLLAYKPTMIFVEHDKAFCDMVASVVARL